MDIILLEKIENVGGIGDRVRVKPGFARNYLIPHGKATLATPDNIAKFEARRTELEAKAKAELDAAQARAATIEGKVLTLRANAGPEGKLFGSIGTHDIATACQDLGLAVERSEVRMPDGPLRVVGEHTIELHLHSDVSIEVKVIVESTEPVELPDFGDSSEDSEADE
jgi:large subunit ribosomal protein L9